MKQQGKRGEEEGAAMRIIRYARIRGEIVKIC